MLHVRQHKHMAPQQQFRCHNCGVLMNVGVNAVFSILFIFYAVQWGRRAQAVYALQNKIGMVLRGKIHLGTCTLPPSVNDVMVGTGCPKVGCQNPTNKRHLNGAPLNGGSSPTSVETQAVYPSDLTLSFIPQ